MSQSFENEVICSVCQRRRCVCLDDADEFVEELEDILLLADDYEEDEDWSTKWP